MRTPASANLTSRRSPQSLNYELPTVPHDLDKAPAQLDTNGSQNISTRLGGSRENDCSRPRITTLTLPSLPCLNALLGEA
jgi:hypothetical protein